MIWLNQTNYDNQFFNFLQNDKHLWLFFKVDIRMDNPIFSPLLIATYLNLYQTPYSCWGWISPAFWGLIFCMLLNSEGTLMAQIKNQLFLWRWKLINTMNIIYRVSTFKKIGSLSFLGKFLLIYIKKWGSISPTRVSIQANP